MKKLVPIDELQNRMGRLRARMDRACPDWKMAIIISKINQFYLTGTMQDGIIIIPRDSDAVYWVRRSFERAVDESDFPEIKHMSSYRDAACSTKDIPDTVYLETDIIPFAVVQRLQKYFAFTNVKSLDSQIAAVRAVKSRYELSLMKSSGEIHQRVLEERVPQILEEGMTEADLAARLFSILLEEGHHGVARFGMFDTEIALGQIGFGEGSIYPTYFNGPGGSYGMSPAVPLLGSRGRRLKNGDLVFVDVACGVDGYHTDKTMTYVFGGTLSDWARDVHLKCVDIQNQMAQMLKPGTTPSRIYQMIMDNLDDEFLKNFMGFGKRSVKFLGHGIGLLIDETPVIAEGFNEPLQEGMAIALEPKKGLKDIGMVGIENTFLVTPEGGICITGTNPGLIKI